MREAEKVERGPHRCRVTSIWTSEPEVYEASLGRMEPKPVPAQSLAQQFRHSLAGPMVLKGHHRVVSVSNQLAPPFESRSCHFLEPLVQHIVQVDVRERWGDNATLVRPTR